MADPNDPLPRAEFPERIPRAAFPDDSPVEFPDRGGLPAPAFPIPVPPTFPQPQPPTGQIIRFPVERTRPPAPPASRIPGIVRAGNAIIGIAIILAEVLRRAQELDIEEEMRVEEATRETIIRRRSLERTPVIVEFPEPRVEPGPDPFEFPLPDFETFPEIPEPSPVPLEIPGVQVPPVPVPEPGEIVVPGPATPTAPRPAAVPAPRPSTVPGIGAEPGVFTPSPRPAVLPIGLPSPVPGIFPVGQPVGLPSPFFVGDPVPLTPTSIPGVRSTPTTFVDVIEFPQPVPQTQPARRCKPCPEEEPPSLRDACFKGLYREGPTTDDVDFTEWAEIDCITGVEI